MIRFSREEYLDGARLTIESRKTAEEAADQIWREGYDNLFLTAVGGSTVPMMAAEAIVKEMTDLPVFVEQAAELAVRGNRNLTAKSVVVTLSKTGDTRETVEIAGICKGKGCRVVSFTRQEDSPLGRNSTFFIPMRHENGVEYEYMLIYWFVLRLLYLRGDFPEYPRFADQMEALPENLLRIKEEFDPRAEEIAAAYWKEPYMIWVGGNEMWGEVYMFTMCILEEMQWIRTKAVTSGEFFHGTLELVDENTAVFLVKGEGACRILDERAERFIRKYGKKYVILDPRDYDLVGIDQSFRWILAPAVISTILVDRLAAHMEAHTNHDLDYRRYYRQFDY